MFFTLVFFKKFVNIKQTKKRVLKKELSKKSIKTCNLNLYILSFKWYINTYSKNFFNNSTCIVKFS